MGGNLDKIEKKTFFSLENGPNHHGFAPVSTCVLNLSARDTVPFLNSFYTWVCTCLHGSERCECEGHCLGETSSKISDCENNHTEGRVPQPNMAFCLTFKISSKYVLSLIGQKVNVSQSLVGQDFHYFSARLSVVLVALTTSKQ